MENIGGLTKEQRQQREERRRSIMASKLITGGELFTTGDASRHLSCYKDKSNPKKITKDQARNLLYKMVDDGILELVQLGKRNYYRKIIPKEAHMITGAWVPDNGIRIGSYDDKSIRWVN